MNRLPDPAVTFANQQGDPNHQYRSWFDEEGDERIHCVEAGAGPVVLFIHGFPSFWYCWFYQMEALKGSHRVIAIDAPGAGRSGKPDGDYHYRIDRLIKRIDRLVIRIAAGERIALVGHDWGGTLAWSYALTHPDRIDRIASFSAPPYHTFLQLLATCPQQRERSAYVEALLDTNLESVIEQDWGKRLYEAGYRNVIENGRIGALDPELFRQALSDPFAINAALAWYRANLRRAHAIGPSRSREASALPMLLIEGAEDHIFAPSMQQMLKQEFPHLETVMISRSGHWTPFEDQVEANRALLGFLF